MSDGNRRQMGGAGVINQRYIVMLDGNAQELVVVSNYDRVRQGVPMRWKAGTWYRIKACTDRKDDGTIIVCGKAWPREEQEPADWQIQVRHPHGHDRGSPGIYGFSPQSMFRVYVDNVEVTPSEAGKN
jgi:hypothetical protein